MIDAEDKIFLEAQLKRSTSRILTTHTGSLPRPWDLVDMMLASEDGSLADPGSMDGPIAQAVHDVVRRQIDAGVDVVNDGEQSKPGYATYVKDRLNGFDGETTNMRRADWEDYADALARLDLNMAASFRPTCTGPLTRKNSDASETDIANLGAALSGVEPEEAFMTAASPGVIAIFLRNEYYSTREEYLSVVADLMREEYEAIYNAGFLLQVDCPDLAMGRHMEFPDLSDEEFLKVAEANIEVLNHAVANIPSDRMRLHLCWGNYEGPHHRDIALRKLLPIVLKAKPDGLSFEGSIPRHEHEWNVFKDVKLPDGKVIIPGVIDSTTNFIEHPELVAQRIVRYAELVGRENVLAGSDCGFGTSVRSKPAIAPDLVWPKLQAMAEGARIASSELW